MFLYADSISAISCDHFLTWNALIVYILVKNILNTCLWSNTYKIQQNHNFLPYPCHLQFGVVYNNVLWFTDIASTSFRTEMTLWIYAKWKQKKGQMYFIKKHTFPKSLAKVIPHQVTRCPSVIAYSTLMVSLIPIKKSRSYPAEIWNITTILCSENWLVRHIAVH